jgi:hypothetical protein
MGWSGAASVALHAAALAWFALGWQVEPPVAAAPIEIALLPPAPPPPPPPAPPLGSGSSQTMDKSRTRMFLNSTVPPSTQRPPLCT